MGRAIFSRAFASFGACSAVTILGHALACSHVGVRGYLEGEAPLCSPFGVLFTSAIPGTRNAMVVVLFCQFLPSARDILAVGIVSVIGRVRGACSDVR